MGKIRKTLSITVLVLAVITVLYILFTIFAVLAREKQARRADAYALSISKKIQSEFNTLGVCPRAIEG